MTISHRGLLLCRVIFLAGALTLSLRGSPSAKAQGRDAGVHDEVIQERLDSLKARIDVQDSKIDKQWLATNSVKESQATMDGELKGFGILLTLISGAGLVIQIRPKAKA